jgi:hypothetical protein
MSPRLPRFKRASTVAPIKLTGRDHEIIRQIYRHRFLRSNQIITLVGGSSQQVVRRLQLLFHHGYLARPRAQLQYYERTGPHHFAYGLGNKGGMLLRHKFGIAVDANSWNEKNHAIGGVYLEHTLLVSEFMVSLELACGQRGIILLYEDQLRQSVEKQPFKWRVEGKLKLGVVPDRVFALEYANENGVTQRSYFFLEADRGTMPVIRKNLVQTSFYRKLLAYEATWLNKIHQRQLGIHRFRVLTVTTSTARMSSLLEACSRLKRGHGLFLFADRTILEKDVLSGDWQCGKTGQTGRLIN